MSVTRDDISIEYDRSNAVRNTSNTLMYSSIALSFIRLFLQGKAFDICSVILMCVSIAYVVLSVIDDCWLWYSAESARRTDAIANGLGINMQECCTEGYYNNDAMPSLTRYALNQFESSFFSKNNSHRMLRFEWIKALAVIVLLPLTYVVTEDSDALLLITQTVFSSSIIGSFADLVCFSVRVSSIYDKFYNEFVTTGIEKDSQTTMLLAWSVEYEAIKAHHKVRLSTKIHKRHNAVWSQQWAIICGNIRQ